MTSVRHVVTRTGARAPVLSRSGRCRSTLEWFLYWICGTENWYLNCTNTSCILLLLLAFLLSWFCFCFFLERTKCGELLHTRTFLYFILKIMLVFSNTFIDEVRTGIGEEFGSVHVDPQREFLVAELASRSFKRERTPFYYRNFLRADAQILNKSWPSVNRPGAPG